MLRGALFVFLPAFGLLAAACAGGDAPHPSPLRGGSTTFPTSATLASTTSPTLAAGTNGDAGPPDASVSPTEAQTSPGGAAKLPEAASPLITIEMPYKLGQRRGGGVASADAGESDAERARWNRGGRGEGESPKAPPEGHPFPRVIIDIVGVKGPLRAPEVQAITRRMMWIKVIGCYQLGAYKDQSLRGKTTVRMQVSRSGKVSGASMRGTSLSDASVAACLAREMKGLALPAKKSGSTVTATIEVHPGDDPMPPPESAVTPGDGTLAPQEIKRVMEEARPRFEACFRESFATAPEVWGRLGIRFHVTATGKVDEAFEAESSFPDPRAVQCVLRAARSLELPAPTGGDLRFVAPMRLAPR